MVSSVKSRPKFRIIEGGSESKYKEIYEDFKADYLSPNITVGKMLEKYDISTSTYNQLRKRVAEETGVNRKMSKVKYVRAWTHHSRFIDYMKTSDKYRVSKVIQGTKTHFGLYDDMETAVYVRDKLEENNWSPQTYKKIREELFGEVDESLKIEEIYDDYKKDFMNGESNKFLRRKYGISKWMCNQLSKRIRSEEGILRKPYLHYKEAWKHERDLHRQ